MNNDFIIRLMVSQFHIKVRTSDSMIGIFYGPYMCSDPFQYMVKSLFENRLK